MRQLVIKVLNIIDARCNHEVCVQNYMQKIVQHTDGTEQIRLNCTRFEFLIN